jgi:hypothetical protein
MVKDLFPARDLVGDRLDARCDCSVGSAAAAGAEGGEAAQEFGHIAWVARDSGSFDGLTKRSVASS